MAARRVRVPGARFAMALLLSAAAGMAAAGTGASAALRVEQAQVLASLPGTTTAIVEMTLRNPGQRAVSLVGLTTTVAARAELHDMQTRGGVMRMRPVSSVSIAPGATLRLGRGGLHVMLIGLRKPLAVGEVVAMRLELADGQRLSVAAPVVAAQYAR